MQEFFKKNINLFIKPRVPTLYNKMELPRGKNRILLEMTRAQIWSPVYQKIYGRSHKILNFKIALDTLTQLTQLPSILTLPPRIIRCTVYIHIPRVNYKTFCLC